MIRRRRRRVKEGQEVDRLFSSSSEFPDAREEEDEYLPRGRSAVVEMEKLVDA